MDLHLLNEQVSREINEMKEDGSVVTYHEVLVVPEVPFALVFLNEYKMLINLLIRHYEERFRNSRYYIIYNLIKIKVLIREQHFLGTKIRNL